MDSKREGGCDSDSRTIDLRHSTEEKKGLKLHKNEDLSAVRGVGGLVMYEKVSKKQKYRGNSLY